MEGFWDGFQRINTDLKNGGIIAVFRHGSTEVSRTVTIKYLDPLKKYRVKTLNDKEICILTGKDLSNIGFEIFLKEVYSGELFEVSVME